jgi:hypothetical protein
MASNLKDSVQQRKDYQSEEISQRMGEKSLPAIHSSDKELVSSIYKVFKKIKHQENK